VDVSDLAESARCLIAAAEIEAKYILRKSQEVALYSTEAPEPEHEQQLCNEPKRNEFSEGRNQAALHLFHATAAVWWDRVKPDLEVFGVSLDAAK
jgi:hypothetical protein